MQKISKHGFSLSFPFELMLSLPSQLLRPVLDSCLPLTFYIWFPRNLWVLHLEYFQNLTTLLTISIATLSLIIVKILSVLNYCCSLYHGFLTQLLRDPFKNMSHIMLPLAQNLKFLTMTYEILHNLPFPASPDFIFYHSPWSPTLVS